MNSQTGAMLHACVKHGTRQFRSDRPLATAIDYEIPCQQSSKTLAQHAIEPIDLHLAFQTLLTQARRLPKTV